MELEDALLTWRPGKERGDRIPLSGGRVPKSQTV